MPVQSPELFMILPPLAGEYAGAIGLSMAAAIGWLARTKDVREEQSRKEAAAMYTALQMSNSNNAALLESNKDRDATLKRATETIDALRVVITQQAEALARQYTAGQEAQRWGRQVIDDFRKELEKAGHDHTRILEALERVEKRFVAA